MKIRDLGVHASGPIVHKAYEFVLLQVDNVSEIHSLLFSEVIEVVELDDVMGEHLLELSLGNSNLLISIGGVIITDVLQFCKGCCLESVHLIMAFLEFVFKVLSEAFHTVIEVSVVVIFFSSVEAVIEFVL
jgi:hypothetical protein